MDNNFIKIDMQELVKDEAFVYTLARGLADKAVLDDVCLYDFKKLKEEAKQAILRIIKEELKEDYMQTEMNKILRSVVADEVNKYINVKLKKED